MSLRKDKPSVRREVAAFSPRRVASVEGPSKTFSTCMMRQENTPIGPALVPELDDRIRFVGDSCLVCGFAKTKAVWVGSNPEWYVCHDCRAKVQRWPEVQALYRAAIKFTEWLNNGEWEGHPMRWPKDERGEYFMGHDFPKAIDPFRYEDKEHDETADAIEFLQKRGYVVEPGVEPQNSKSVQRSESERLL